MTHWSHQHVCLQALDKSVHAAMKQVSEYFGELHEAGDPARVLRVIRNFMPVFDKTLEEVKVQAGCI